MMRERGGGNQETDMSGRLGEKERGRERERENEGGERERERLKERRPGIERNTGRERLKPLLHDALQPQKNLRFCRAITLAPCGMCNNRTQMSQLAGIEHHSISAGGNHGLRRFDQSEQG